MVPFILCFRNRPEHALFLLPEEAKALQFVMVTGGVAKIKRAVAEYYQIPTYSLDESSRRRRYARPRQIAMYLARTMEGKSLPWIGASFGGRDHTTVLHACREMTKHVDSNDGVAAEIAEIRTRLA